jgi:hypothetical protein
MSKPHGKYQYNRRTRKRMLRQVRRRVRGWEVTLGLYTVDQIRAAIPSRPTIISREVKS